MRVTSKMYKYPASLRFQVEKLIVFLPIAYALQLYNIVLELEIASIILCLIQDA